MKKPLLLAGLLLAAASTFAAESNIELTGVSTDSKGTRLLLLNPADNTSSWVSVGGTCAGYKVDGYDPASETVALTKDGTTLRLRLKSSKVAPAEPLTPQRRQLIQRNLRKLVAASDQFFLETGKKSATIADLVGVQNYVRSLEPVAGENYGDLLFAPGNDNISVTTATGETISFNPKDDAPPQAAVVAGEGELVIKPGDTAARIASNAGLTLADLAKLNPDVQWSKLKIGQKIRVK